MAKLKLLFTDTNSCFKFRLMCIPSGIVHAVFLVEFLIMGLSIPAWFNVVSVLLYLAASIVTIKRDISDHALVWILAIFGEMLVHAALCTVLLGTESFFYLYSIISLPVLVYYLFLFYDKKTCIKTFIIFGAAVFIIMTAAVVFSEITGGVYNLSENKIFSRNMSIMRILNIFVAIFMVFAFSLMFYVEVRDLLDGLRASNDKLNYIATHDFLTGLANRRSFWEFYGGIEKKGSHYCIFMGDLDNFKSINDTYGHDVGDTVLKSVSEIILNTVSKEDIACRWGGEEILVILCGSREECLPRVEAIKRHINLIDIRHEDKHVHVSMTFGFADCDEIDIARESAKIQDDNIKRSVRSPNGSDIECLIALVDKRLYIGKRGGKNVIISA